jgi:hypothetical protein
MVTKNYRIFRIFNNIFITRTIVTDLQLLKASAVIIVVQAVSKRKLHCCYAVIVLFTNLTAGTVSPLARTGYCNTGQCQLIAINLLCHMRI